MKRIVLLLILCITIGLNAQQLYINEIVADNDNIIADEQGDFDDWIEIYNPTGEAVDLGGYFLSDTADELDQYEVPTDSPDITTIPAGGFLLIWCDDDDDDGPLHTNFKLSAGGEAVYLTEWNGSVVTDSYEFGEQTTDVSEGRVTDGADEWQFFTSPTPGATNGAENQPPLISEWQQLTAFPGADEQVAVVAVVTDEDLSQVLISYTTSDQWQEAVMYDDGAHNDGIAGDDIFGGFIPGFAAGSVVKYKIMAIDEDGQESCFPVNTPQDEIEYECGWIRPELYINEFMASNDTTITDPEGEYEDWIEIYNGSDEALDLAGYWFTDDSENLASWHQIPADNPDLTTIDAGGFLLLWADDDTDDGAAHVNFKLSADGESFGCYAFFGTTGVDTLSYQPLENDVSLGRLPDGSDNWEMFGIGLENPATPGYSNQPSAADIDILIPQVNSISSIYPNPFNIGNHRGELTVDLNIADESQIMLGLYNVKGQKLSSQAYTDLNNGVNRVSYSIPAQAASGIYFLKLQNDSSAAGKFIIIR